MSFFEFNDLYEFKIIGQNISKLARELMIVLNCVIYGLQVKSFKSFSNDFCLVCLIVLGSHHLRFCLFGWHCSIDLLVRYIRSVLFNSLDCISGLVLLCFFISSSWFLLRPYDVTVTFCSFVRAISTELHVWRHFSLLVERVFLFMRVIIFLVTLDLPHSQKWLPHFEIDFYLL